jgi:hypothetical protein
MIALLEIIVQLVLGLIMSMCGFTALVGLFGKNIGTRMVGLITLNFGTANFVLSIIYLSTFIEEMKYGKINPNFLPGIIFSVGWMICAIGTWVESIPPTLEKKVFVIGLIVIIMGLVMAVAPHIVG